VILLLALLATSQAAPERAMPAPLAAGDFVMPAEHTATLSNGVEVRLVENHEVPLWSLRVVVRAGPETDPADKIGLRSVTLSMLDQGAGGLDAAKLAASTKRLGGSVGAGASRDTFWVGASGPTDTFGALLDVWASVLLHPDFPADRWTIQQRQLIENLAAARQDPDAIAGRVQRHLVYGASYVGRLESEAAYAAITAQDQRDWYSRYLDPKNAVILVGGDLSLDAVVDALNARLGGWTRSESSLAETTPTPLPFDHEVIYVVDKPGAAQSVVRTLLPVGDRSDESWWGLYLGNTAFGGAFTARVNMNLREDKGWTYGARCGVDDGAGPSLWNCSTNIQTDKTAPAVSELRREIADVVDSRPITDKEIAFFGSYRVNAFSGQYETPSALLGQLQDIWTYHLPADWVAQYIPRVSAVTPDSANSALRRWLQPSHVSFLIVGDVARIGPDLAKLGLPVVQLDVDGPPLEPKP
jgi:predicted Zn-dependent peptidase